MAWHIVAVYSSLDLISRRHLLRMCVFLMSGVKKKSSSSRGRPLTPKAYTGVCLRLRAKASSLAFMYTFTVVKTSVFGNALHQFLPICRQVSIEPFQFQ